MNDEAYFSLGSTGGSSKLFCIFSPFSIFGSMLFYSCNDAKKLKREAIPPRKSKKLKCSYFRKSLRTNVCVYFQVASVHLAFLNQPYF